MAEEKDSLTIFWVMLALALMFIFGLLVLGCGVPPAPRQHANNVDGPVKPAGLSDPTIVFVGDQITVGWASSQTWPDGLWTSKAVANETSTQALAGFQAVLSAKPNIVHVMVGMQDIWAGPNFGVDPELPTSDLVIQNLTSMIQEAQAADIPIIVGELPPGVPGTPAEPKPGIDVSIAIVDDWIDDTASHMAGVTVAKYFVVLSPMPPCAVDDFCGYDPEMGVSGATAADGSLIYTPSASGYQAMTDALEPIVESTGAANGIGVR